MTDRQTNSIAPGWPAGILAFESPLVSQMSLHWVTAAVWSHTTRYKEGLRLC